MKKTLKQIAPVILDVLPHLTLVLALMHVVFLIVDLYNRAMAFVNNDITKWLLFITAVFVLTISYDLHKNAPAKTKFVRITLRSCVITSMLVVFVLLLDMETRVINSSTVKYLFYIYTVIIAILSVCDIRYRRQLKLAENE